MHTILDLDLDFVHPTAHHRGDAAGRLSSSEYKVTQAAEVENFLETRCHLTTLSRLPSREIEHHVDAYWAGRGGWSVAN